MENYHFQRDNDGYYMLPHPPQSPNLNSTERLWDGRLTITKIILKDELKQKKKKKKKILK